MITDDTIKYIENPLDKDKERSELYGRMYECLDIQSAIESGQFKSIQDVLSAVIKRSRSIDLKLNYETN